MVIVRYLGTLGNQLWQYVVGRALAENRGELFFARGIRGFRQARPIVFGNVGNVGNVGKGFGIKKYSGHELPKPSEGEIAILQGYFQRFSHLVELGATEKAKNWARPSTSRPQTSPRAADLVVSVRRGWNGYPTTQCPDVEIYMDIIRNLNVTTTWITTDSPSDPYFEPLRRSGLPVQFVDGSAIEQYRFIASSNRIVVAPSTFSWWASYVSQADEIYWPKIPALSPIDGGPDWFPHSDKRYVEI